MWLQSSDNIKSLDKSTGLVFQDVKGQSKTLGFVKYSSSMKRSERRRETFREKNRKEQRTRQLDDAVGSHTEAKM